MFARHARVGISFADEEWFWVSQQQRTDRILRWVRALPDATFIVATDAGHFVHADDPELVTEAIRRVVIAAGDRP